MPKDLVAALQDAPQAEKHWTAFPKSAQKGILQWIEQAKTPATRQKRIAETITLAFHNLRANTSGVQVKFAEILKK